MAAPTTPIFDVGNRTENPLSDSGRWSGDFQGLGHVLLDSGTAIRSASGAVVSTAWRNAFSIVDGEVYFTSTGNQDLFAALRIKNPGTAFTGYLAEWDGTGITIYRVTAGAATSIKNTATGGSTVNGDVCWFQVIGATLNQYKNGTLQQSVTDTTYLDGFVGIGTSASGSLGLNNVGGGNLGPFYRSEEQLQAVKRAAGF